jgi:hypothetical protein
MPGTRIPRVGFLRNDVAGHGEADRSVRGARAWQGELMMTHEPPVVTL